MADIGAQIAHDSDETDSAFGDDSASETTSLKSAVYNYKYRNGRRYHAYKEGSYCGLPARSMPMLFLSEHRGAE